MPELETAGGIVGAALKVLNQATKRVPATRYALAVAGVGAAAAIVRLFAGGDFNKGVCVLAAMFVFVVAMLVFAKMTTLSQGAFKYPGLAMLWSCLLLFIASATLTLASVFFGKPLDWRPAGTAPSPDRGVAERPDPVHAEAPHSFTPSLPSPNGGDPGTAPVGSLNSANVVSGAAGGSSSRDRTRVGGAPRTVTVNNAPASSDVHSVHSVEVGHASAGDRSHISIGNTKGSSPPSVGVGSASAGNDSTISIGNQAHE